LLLLEYLVILVNFCYCFLYRKYSIFYYPYHNYSNLYRVQDIECQSIYLFIFLNLQLCFTFKIYIFRYDPSTDKLEASVVCFTDKDLKAISRLMFYVFRKLRFIQVKETIEETKDNKIIRYESTNFTIINLFLTILGPTHEKTLTIILLGVQVSYLSIKNLLFLIYQIFFWLDCILLWCFLHTL
jgi:hypothetical protein